MQMHIGGMMGENCMMPIRVETQNLYKVLQILIYGTYGLLFGCLLGL